MSPSELWMGCPFVAILELPSQGPSLHPALSKLLKFTLKERQTHCQFVHLPVGFQKVFLQKRHLRITLGLFDLQLGVPSTSTPQSAP